MKLIIGILVALYSSISVAKMAKIPLQKTAEGHLYVQASINNVEASFILDTGATGSVIGLNQLAKFGVKISEDKIEGVRGGDEEQGRVATYPVEIDAFSIGKHEINITNIFTNDTSGRLDSDVAGLIGQDVLNSLNALIDLQTPQLLIPQAPADIAKLFKNQDYVAVDLQHSAMGFSFVDIELGKHKVRLLVDSGASELVLDESALTKLGFTLTTHPTAKSIVGEGVELPMKVLNDVVITLGHAKLQDSFLVSDFGALMNAINQNQQRLFVGVLGNKQLLELNSIIHLSDNKLYIQP